MSSATNAASNAAASPAAHTVAGSVANAIAGAAPGPLAPDADLRFTHQLLQMLAVPVFVLDSNAQVLIWNRACERLTGVPAIEVIGTEDHWRSFYEQRRPTLADLVIQNRTDEIRHIYPRHGKPQAAQAPQLPLSIET